MKPRRLVSLGIPVLLSLMLACQPSATIPSPPNPAVVPPRTGQLAQTDLHPGDAPGTEEPSVESGVKDGMVRIPAGAFLRGCNADVDQTCDEDEKPSQEVLQDDYWIDKTEVTVADFRRCVEAGQCEAPVDRSASGRCNWGDTLRDRHPVNCVNWSQADAYCRWAGKRLPSESEWEKAARGGDGRKFPWGNEPVSCDLSIWRDQTNGDGCGREGTWPVCSKEAGNSPFGLCDMSGNVWEWVADWYDAGFYTTGPLKNPINGTASEFRVIRGGSWDCGYDVALRASERGWVDGGLRPFYAGFRCASSPRSEGTAPQRPGWVRIPAATFQMGSEVAADDAKPVHEMTVPEFEMATTEVTVRQYSACVEAGACTVPHFDDGKCHVPLEGRWGAGVLPEAFRGLELPVVCVDWEQAQVFAKWSDARLCSEAEWECAARSGGEDIRFPWGDDAPTCAWAVMNDEGPGCGEGVLWPPCSRDEGTSKQGVCDLVGNVSEWVVDWYQPYRPGAPSTAEGPLAGVVKVFRGGSFVDSAFRLTSRVRRRLGPTRSAADRGIRLCR